MTPTLAHILAALAIGVLAAAQVTALGRVHRAAPGWWQGYAEDGIHLGTAGSLIVLYMVAGWSGAAALAGGCLTTLMGYFVDWTRRRLGVPGLVCIGLAAAWGVALIWRGADIMSAVATWVAWCTPAAKT